MGKWISTVAVATTMLWIGLVCTVALAIVHRVEPIDFIDPPLVAILLPLFLSFLGVGALFLSESGAIGRLRRNRGATRGDASDQSPAVSRAEIDRILKEGDEWIANYKETLSKLASKGR